MHVKNRAIGLLSWLFGNGLGDQSSIPGRVIWKTQKMLSTQDYKMRIKGKVKQSWEWSIALP